MLKNFFFFALIYFTISCTQNVKSTRSQLYQDLEDKDLNAVMTTLQMSPEIRNLKRYHDSDGNNILHLIIEKNDVDVFKTLTANPKYTLPYNRYNNQYNSPLNYAVSLGRCQLVELLLIKGADPLYVTNDHPTVLVQSMLEKRYGCMESILIQSPKAVNQLGFNDWQALHYASYTADKKALKLLFPYKPDLYKEVPIELGVPFYSKEMIMGIGDVNPFHIAVVKGNLSIAKYLFEKKPEYINRPTSNGTTNSELAEISKSPSMIAWIESMNPEIKSRSKPKIKPATKEPIFNKDMQNISKKSKTRAKN